MTEHVAASQDDTIEIVPGTTLNLRNQKDREDYHRLLLFLSYLADVGVGAHVTLAIARDLYSGALTGEIPAASDATEIFGHARRDIDRTDTEISLADAIGFIGGLATVILGGEPATAPEPQPRVAPVTYDLRKVAEGAPSLALLTEYAQRVSRSIIPEEALPTQEFVKRCLAIFHWLKLQSLAEEVVDVDEAVRNTEDDSQPGTTPAAAIEGTSVFEE